MKRKISRHEKRSIRDQLAQIKMEDLEAEETQPEPQNKMQLEPDFRKAQREARKNRKHQIQTAGNELETITSAEDQKETLKVYKQFFFSEGDMVQYKRDSRVVMEGEDNAVKYTIGLVISTKDIVHKNYPSGKPKLVSICTHLTVLVGSLVEEWSSKNVRLCE
jgi:hypothetical protein|tara:strand:+ start:4903 stop:5391 length:489 start_codon:yes stop_codon:yes gene_type:complete